MRNSTAKFSTRAPSLVSIMLYQKKIRLFKCGVTNVGFGEIKGRNPWMWSKEICGVSSHQHLSWSHRDFRASLNCNLGINLTLWVMEKNGVQSDSIKWGRWIYFSRLGCSIQWSKAFFVCYKQVDRLLVIILEIESNICSKIIQFSKIPTCIME